MQIYIVDRNAYKCDALAKAIDGAPNVAICHANIIRFVNEHKDIDCLVSPANAFGMMTGGYDAALSNNLGCDFRYKVQWFIQEHFCGEQGVAPASS